MWSLIARAKAHALHTTPSRLALVAWAAAGVVLVWSLVVSALPGNHSWLRRFQTPELTREYTFAQRFTMNRDGLDGVELHPASMGTRPAGDIRFALVDLTDSPDGSVIRTGVVPAAELAGRSSYRFDFAPVAGSRHRTFRFEVAATNASSGVALVATRGLDRYPEGALTVNGRSRWAALLFQTFAPNSSIWSTLWTSRTESGASGRLVLALLAVNWLALGVLFRILGGIMASDRGGPT